MIIDGLERVLELDTKVSIIVSFSNIKDCKAEFSSLAILSCSM